MFVSCSAAIRSVAAVAARNFICRNNAALKTHDYSTRNAARYRSIRFKIG
jgi:hypothetical protein